MDQLSKLQLLDLSNTPLDDLHFTEQVPSLTSLPLYWKTSQDGEDFEYDFKKERYIVNNPGIYLYNCHQLVEPSPAWVQLGKEAVQDYFQAIKTQGKITLREAKLMLVGRPNIGKTTLSGKLRDINSPLPPSNASTKGIAVKSWEYKQDGKDYTINIWDFGGQDIQYSLHQFFMTERAIYGLLDSTREYQDQAAGGDLYANYWLQTIEKLAQGSPTFHVYNHYDGQVKNTSIHTELCTQYDFLEKEPTVVDLMHVHEDAVEQKNLELLQAKIKQEVAKLPNVGLVLPKKWAAVRQKLLEQAKETAIISLESYQRICKQQDIHNKEVMLLLSRYLHQIGSLIHYNKDNTSSLYKLLILRRNWATEAVYKVALSPLVDEQGGIFERQDLAKIWQADKDLPQEQAESYQAHLPELLELLRKFEVCYPYGDQFLVPQLVATKCPEVVPTPTDKPLQLEYSYDFMPYGLIYRLAVRLHRYIQEKQIWRKGMVLTTVQDGQKGWIVLQEQRRQQQGSIYLSINGDKNARYFLQQQIKEELDQLHTIYNISDQVTLLVPCTCPSCVPTTEPPYQFKYKEQLFSKLKANKGQTIECQKHWNEVPILELIDHAFPERPSEVQHLVEKQKRAFGDHHHYYGDVHQAETMSVNKNENSNNSNSHNTAEQQGTLQTGDQNVVTNQQRQEAAVLAPSVPKTWQESWWLWVGLSALLAGGVVWWILAIWLPDYAIIGALIATIVTGFVVYRLNPKFLYKNYAGLFFTTALFNAAFNISYNLIYKPSDKVFLQFESAEDWVTVVLTILFVIAGSFCLWLHALQQKK